MSNQQHLIVLYVIILSFRVLVLSIELVNLQTLLLVHMIVTNFSKSLTFTLTNSHFIDPSTSTFFVVSHCNIHRKRWLRKSLISSLCVNSANSNDIFDKFIVGRDKLMF